MPQSDQSCQHPGQHDQSATSGVGGAPKLAGPAQPFTIEARIIQGTATLILSGELDVIVMPALAGHLTQILASKPRHLIFDMARVTFIDCATARLITRTGQSLPSSGRVLIQQPSAAVRRVLELTGLASHCDIRGRTTNAS
jgi:anti-sigma B factor antagonist